MNSLLGQKLDMSANSTNQMCNEGSVQVVNSESLVREALACLYPAEDANGPRYRRATELFERAMLQGSFRASAWIGYLEVTREAKDGSIEDGFRRISAAAQRGDIVAEGFLGFCYEHGLGVQRDYREAEARYRASLKNNSFSQTHLAIMMVSGLTMQGDKREAAKLLSDPANNGVRLAQFYLGSLLLESSKEENVKQAAVWLDKAARHNDPRAAYLLAGLYQSGRGVTKAPHAAVSLLRTAAAANYPKAYSALAACYVRGLGVDKDRVQAYLWYEKASKGGDSVARLKQKALADTMTDAERERAVSASNLASPVSRF